MREWREAARLRGEHALGVDGGTRLPWAAMGLWSPAWLWHLRAGKVAQGNPVEGTRGGGGCVPRRARRQRPGAATRDIEHVHRGWGRPEPGARRPCLRPGEGAEGQERCLWS